MKLTRWSGAGNDFIVIDGRALKERVDVKALCSRYGTDGLMILRRSPRYDFRMEFFNPDGTGGMMCGNGGRCIVAFAAALGIQPGSGRDELARNALSESTYLFEAPDGVHTADILRKEGGRSIVRLKMRDVFDVENCLEPEGYFLNTGTRHFVSMVEDVDTINLLKEGKEIRMLPQFAPEGVNANFLSKLPDGSIKVRTFEKGVEGETPACGTGITAAAIAARFDNIPPTKSVGRRCRYEVHARSGDTLFVDFVYMRIVDYKAHFPTYSATDVYLIGPAEEVPLEEEILI